MNDLMKCEWKWCCEEATKIVFRPVEGIVKDAQKRRIWNENLSVCNTCLEPASSEYPYESFVRPENYEANYNLGCWL